LMAVRATICDAFQENGAEMRSREGTRGLAAAEKLKAMARMWAG